MKIVIIHFPYAFETQTQGSEGVWRVAFKLMEKQREDAVLDEK